MGALRSKLNIGKSEWRALTRAPIHPGEYVREGVLEAHNMTQQQLADALGLSRLSVNEIVTGKRSITEHTALRLEQLTGVEAELWLDLQREYNLWHAKREDAAVLEKIRRLNVGARRA